MNWLSWGPFVLLGLAGWSAISFAVSAIRAETTITTTRVWVLRDRSDVVNGVAECVAWLTLSRALVPWHLVPPMIWGVTVSIALFALFTAVRAWPLLPAVGPGRRRWKRSISIAGYLGFAVASVVLATG